ncbi:MAG: hypothetical protein FJ147_04040 [Deltaproteobacteria bacterium]|nr:hypothetical protein [Deltaproteobacteria bacterium]
MGGIGLIAIGMALVGRCLVLGWRHRMPIPVHHWLLLFCMLLLPVAALLATISSVAEDTKTVGFCATCHVMQVFVNDMRNPESRLLAARHYQNRWIANHQCYTCHITYGLHGSFAGKRAALRHWLRYVTGSWSEPITHTGPYPNTNCLNCHADASGFRHVGSHQSRLADLQENRVKCVMCHGLPHPAPEDRHVSG